MEFLLAHLVGDFIIQTDWMANGKKRKSLICMIHVITYLLPFFFLQFLWWQLVLIGIQHFIQDRWGFVVWFMNKAGHKKFASSPMSPWSIIVTDNIFHLVWIYFVINYF